MANIFADMPAFMPLPDDGSTVVAQTDPGSETIDDRIEKAKLYLW